ncbi:MerR family transcriptional regulator [Clostridium saccharoperbutylacetonicum]|uniref:MerR family transcriptional regulator n=1 Tax=Clostridium saccharoperbutylacetonicum TaxID=36745 RepID=UPI000983BE86|nr:MerR family DNA-binding transcriptional regulator [Clostridium saccharoperbutylacetonicum]AQR95034.1 HTH-type transcriptional activator mta [Clostridium saccharoperbutylacetonicum]NSB30880.1 DNA-binding transcriptional MerR regulator [Clostridium saccharoperbutylacetonicum]
MFLKGGEILKISEFAKRSGVTVKALRYYDRIGLLQPSVKTDSGYRIYCDEDFIKLQQVTTLKFIGLSLDEIKQLINNKHENIHSMIDVQTRALEESKKHIDIVLTALYKAKAQLENYNNLEVQQLIDIIKITNMETKAKQRFNNASKQYVTDSYYWRSKTAELINELVRPQIKDVILDLGCGTGKQLIELSTKVRLGIGIDISEGMLSQAKINLKNEKASNIEFYTGTFEEPELSVDLYKKGITKIITNYALHHLSTYYKQKVIKKMIDIGGEALEKIIIGDLMFFENPENHKDEFNVVGYGPEVDFPSRVEELMECFSNFNFTVEVHKLHPLVGIIVANRIK